MTQTLKTLIPLAVVFALLVATNVLFASWTAPSGTPSASNNAPAPINVSSVSQVKNGALGVDGLAVFGVATVQNEIRSPKYCDENGGNCFNAIAGTTGNTIAYTNSGYFSYTVPTGVTKLKIEVGGAGGGGGSSLGTTAFAGDGGDSSVGIGQQTIVQATGGLGGQNTVDNGNIPNGEYRNYRHGREFPASGGIGDYTLIGKGAPGGSGGSFEYQTQQYDSIYDSHNGHPGNFTVKTISVTPGDILDIFVGSGGVGTNNTDDEGGANGVDGYVIITQYGTSGGGS